MRRRILTPIVRVDSPDCQKMAFMLLTAYYSPRKSPPETPLIHPAKSALAAICALVLSAPLALAQSGAADGQKLAFDRGKGNCLTCHEIKGGDLPGTIGPQLKDLKAKYDRNELTAIVTDETKRNPLTVMPPFGRNRILTEQEIGAIVDFLQTL
jgi:L-cysteine S-thiosulfotransferase